MMILALIRHSAQRTCGGGLLQSLIGEFLLVIRRQHQSLRVNLSIYPHPSTAVSVGGSNNSSLRKNEGKSLSVIDSVLICMWSD